MLFTDEKKNKRRPYWNYAISTDGKKRIPRRPYWNYAIYRDGKKIEFPGGHIGIMSIIEIP